MLWVLQSDLHREAGYDRLVTAVDRLGLPRVFVRPHAGRLRHGDSDDVAADTRPEPAVDTSGPVIAMGSYALAQVAVNRGWAPGAFIENTDYGSVTRGWGQERVLNGDAWIGPLRDAVLTKPAFVRPRLDSKAFDAKVYEPAGFALWQARMLQDSKRAHGDVDVVVARPRVIYSETRCFVVDQRVVSASLYRVGGQVRFEEVRLGSALDFAASCLMDWVPSRAFVLDVADTPDGHKVIEVNCINASGFYACDVQQIVVALETAFSE